MEFRLLGEQVIIDPARLEYNQYRLMFQKEAGQAVQRFQSLYQKNTSLEMVVQNALEQMYQSFSPAVKRCIQVLVDHGILIMDETRFLETYSDVLESAYNAYERVVAQYEEIVLSEKEKDAYRVARREGRGRWRGGGFGVSGAVKGAATAGALNIVSGAGHMVFNGVAKIGSSMVASSKMNKIFQDKATFSGLCEGLKLSVFNMHYALIDCLAQNGAGSQAKNGAVSTSDREAAQSILRNVPQIRDYNQQKDAMIKSFQLNPYQREWYRYALKQYGDPEDELEAAERYFGLSVIREEKRQQLSAFAKRLPLDTEEQALSAAQQIKQEQDRLHYWEETDETKAILAAVEHFDAIYRTVDGITLSTRNEADIARSELQAIQSIEQKIDYSRLDSIRDGEQKIGEYSSPVAKAHQKMLHQKWDDLDTELRSVSTLLPDGKKVLCETCQQAEQMRPVVQSLKAQLDSCGTKAASEEALITLKEAVNTAPVSLIIKESYGKEIDSRLCAIDLELRTALGKEYSSREAAREAEHQYKQIRSDFSTGNPRKNGAAFRERIEAADFPDQIQKQLLDELFQLENAKEIKATKAFTNISTGILLVIIIASYFFHLSGTPAFAGKDITIKGVSLMVTDIQAVEKLNFLDGLKNGLFVFGRSMGDIFVNGFFEYIGGFDYGWIGNILWAFLGLFWVLIKQFCIGIARYFVSLVVTLFQSAPIRYYIGYIIGAAIPLVVSQFSFDEDKQVENVQRIKGWTVKKICLAILTVMIVAAIILFFLRQEL